MRRTMLILILASALLTPATSARPQTSAGNGSMIQRIVVEGQERSRVHPLAQTLLDSIGPRLTGSVEQRRANEWVLAQYRKWGIAARAEEYGTWVDWRRSIAHI